MSAREGEEVKSDQILGKASGWGSLARYVTDMTASIDIGWAIGKTRVAVNAKEMAASE